jgi:hypothetical protein
VLHDDVGGELDVNLDMGREIAAMVQIARIWEEVNSDLLQQ